MSNLDPLLSEAVPAQNQIKAVNDNISSNPLIINDSHVMHELSEHKISPLKKNAPMQKLFALMHSTHCQERSKKMIAWLKAHSYYHVADVLEEDKRLALMVYTSAPILIEQLVILHHALRHLPQEKQEAIFENALNLAYSDAELSEENNSKPEVLAIVEKLGVLTHQLDGKEDNDLREQALTKAGFLNIGLLLSIKETTITMQNRIEQLVNSPYARSIIPIIRIQTTEAPIHSVVRTCLGLSDDVKLTDHHARLAALTAAFSHIRQLPSSTCFSIVICHYQLTNNIAGALHDFQQLLWTSKLRRKTGHAMHEFPFLLGTTNHALLAAWSCSIAGMGEAKISGMFKSELFKATQAALNVTYTGVDDDLKELLHKQIMIKFLQQVQYLYDPAVTGKECFVLYERDKKVLAYNWKRIDSPNLFQELLSKIILEAGDKVKDKSELIERMALHLNHYVKSELFIKKLLANYSPYQFEKEFTPWITSSGNDTEKTLQVYFEKQKPFDSEKIKTKNAQEFLEQLIQFGRNVQKEKLHCVPTRISGLHAFNVMLDHPTLQRALQSSEDPLMWIQREMIQPGEEIAQTIITVQTQAKICSYIAAKIKNIPATFKEEIAKLPKTLILVEFRNHLCKILSPISHSVIDTIILASLPDKPTILHIADSNWLYDEQDLHFCLFYNPCNGKIVLWRVVADNTSLNPLDQKLWIDNKEWEIFHTLR